MLGGSAAKRRHPGVPAYSQLSRNAYKFISRLHVKCEISKCVVRHDSVDARRLMEPRGSIGIPSTNSRIFRFEVSLLKGF